MSFSGDGLNVDGIGHFIQDNFLTVPPYQRSYAWKRDNVTEFWEDIRDAIDEDDDDYFIGSIVLAKTEKGALEVVDGQQRLATTTIILGAIRDFLLSNSKTQRAQVLESKYLVSDNEDTLEKVPRVRLNARDNPFFKTHVILPPESGKRKSVAGTLKGIKGPESHKRLAEACDLIRGFIHDHVKGLAPDRAESRLQKIVTYLREHVKLIAVIVPDHEDAYTIFETLNDRGLDLSKADLLKNHLFRMAGDSLKEVEGRWDNMIGALQTVGRTDITVDYIRYNWISTHGHVREKNLYSTIKDEVDGEQDAIELSEDLVTSAVLYSAILNSDHPYWGQYGENATIDLGNLIMLGIDRMHPITLSVARKFGRAEVIKSLNFLVCASVRILIASPSPGGTFEQRIAVIAPKIHSGEIASAKELAVAMSEKIVPGDKEFETEFAVANVSRNDLARYYLRALENANAVETHPSRVSSMQIKGTVEHILPAHPSAAWSHVPSETAKAIYKRIGNLALMRDKDNSDIGNKDFVTVKVPAYKEQPFALTNSVASSYSTWDESTIEERQKELAKLAVKAWPIRVK